MTSSLLFSFLKWRGCFVWWLIKTKRDGLYPVPSSLPLHGRVYCQPIARENISGVPLMESKGHQEPWGSSRQLCGSSQSCTALAPGPAPKPGEWQPHPHPSKWRSGVKTGGGRPRVRPAAYKTHCFVYST